MLIKQRCKATVAYRHVQGQGREQESADERVLQARVRATSYLCPQTQRKQLVEININTQRDPES